MASPPVPQSLSVLRNDPDGDPVRRIGTALAILFNEILTDLQKNDRMLDNDNLTEDVVVSLKTKPSAVWLSLKLDSNLYEPSVGFVNEAPEDVIGNFKSSFASTFSAIRRGDRLSLELKGRTGNIIKNGRRNTNPWELAQQQVNAHTRGEASESTTDTNNRSEPTVDSQ